jgi:hypothetical protein
MTTSPDPRPRRSFPREGFTLFLDASGVEIRVDDYHAKPLRLSWELLERMRQQGRSAAAEGAGDPDAGGA